MPLAEDKLQAPESFPTLEDGTYQVMIADIAEHIGKDYNDPTKEVEQYRMELVCLDGDMPGHVLPVWCSRKYGPAKGQRPESKLYTIVTKAFKKVVASEDLHLNTLIGKQLKVVVTRTINEAGYERNKIMAFQEAKKDLEVTEDVATMAKQVMETPEDTTSKINVDEIPF